jgi:hypothetical protein
MLAAFYNGYPLVYSDTSTYLASGFELQTPVDRPITYGLFIRLTSLNGFSLWATVFFQSLILSCLLFLLLKQFTNNPSYLKWGLALILFLSLFTGISWSSGQLIADVFTPIALLSLVVLLVGNISKRTGIFLYMLYFLAVSMHMSHILLFGLLLIFIYLFKKWLFKKELLKNIRLKVAILFVLTGAAIFTMGSAISKSKDVFMMGAMVEQGITKTYLDEYCGVRHYKLCAYKDSLPKTLNAFVWDTNSPFYKTGGWSAENRKELNSIIGATLTEPKYIGLHIKASIKATLQQLVNFHIGDGNGKFLTGTLLFQRIGKFVPGDITSYSSSRQNQPGFSGMATTNRMFDYIILFSILLLMLVLLLKGRKLSGNFTSMAFIFIMAIILNAWDTGTFSCVADRFGCKMMWVIPFLLGLGLFKLYLPSYQPEKETAETNT